jgi:hypothetical protein
MMNIPPAPAAPGWRQEFCTPSTNVQLPSPAPSPPSYDYYLSTPPDSFSQPAVGDADLTRARNAGPDVPTHTAVLAAVAAPERLSSIWQGEVAAKRYLVNSGAWPPADPTRPLGGRPRSARVHTR